MEKKVNSKIKEYHKTFYFHVLLVSVLMALAILFIGIVLKEAFFSYLLFFLVLLLFLYLPIIYVREEHTITSNKVIEDVVEEMKGASSPMRAAYTNFGAKVIEDSETRTILEILKPKLIGKPQRIIIEFKLIDEIPNKFMDIEEFENDKKIAKYQTIFKKEKNHTEILSKSLCFDRQPLFSLLVYLPLYVYMSKTLKSCDYELKKYGVKISLSCPIGF